MQYVINRAGLNQTLVSILTRSEERMQFCKEIELRDSRQVSILTRSEERMQFFHTQIIIIPYPCFNPHPLRRADAMPEIAAKQEQPILVFQSSPAPKSGCNRVTTTTVNRQKFQSSPAPKSGCNID